MFIGLQSLNASWCWLRLQAILIVYLSPPLAQNKSQWAVPWLREGISTLFVFVELSRNCVIVNILFAFGSTNRACEPRTQSIKPIRWLYYEPKQRELIKKLSVSPCIPSHWYARDSRKVYNSEINYLERIKYLLNLLLRLSEPFYINLAILPSSW